MAMVVIVAFFSVTLTTAAPLQNNTILNSNSDFSFSSTFQSVYATSDGGGDDGGGDDGGGDDGGGDDGGGDDGGGDDGGGEESGVMKEVKKVVMKEVKKVVMKEVKKVVMKEVKKVVMKVHQNQPQQNQQKVQLALVQQEIHLHSLAENLTKVHQNQHQQKVQLEQEYNWNNWNNWNRR